MSGESAPKKVAEVQERPRMSGESAPKMVAEVQERPRMSGESAPKMVIEEQVSGESAPKMVAEEQEEFSRVKDVKDTCSEDAERMESAKMTKSARISEIDSPGTKFIYAGVISCSQEVDKVVKQPNSPLKSFQMEKARNFGCGLGYDPDKTKDVKEPCSKDADKTEDSPGSGLGDKTTKSASKSRSENLRTNFIYAGVISCEQEIDKVLKQPNSSPLKSFQMEKARHFGCGLGYEPEKEARSQKWAETPEGAKTKDVKEPCSEDADKTEDLPGSGLLTGDKKKKSAGVISCSQEPNALLKCFGMEGYDPEKEAGLGYIVGKVEGSQMGAETTKELEKVAEEWAMHSLELIEGEELFRSTKLKFLESHVIDMRIKFAELFKSSELTNFAYRHYLGYFKHLFKGLNALTSWERLMDTAHL